MPTYAPPYASGTPILSQVSTAHQKSTGSPQPIPQLTHSIHMAVLHTYSSRPLYNTAHTTADLISCMGGATHPPHNHTHSTSSPPSSRPRCQQIPTVVVHLINFLIRSRATYTCKIMPWNASYGLKHYIKHYNYSEVHKHYFFLLSV